ncbi:MAG: hypothetical protein JSS72_00250 [Armatimonadetes bacterium]|nr:hypothetical protein [Armatimonadota bacterium]
MMNTNFTGQLLTAPVLDQLAPMVVSIGFFAVIIVMALLRHQRKMAELMHSQIDNQANSNIELRLASLESQVADLRTLLHREIIQQDSLTPPRMPSEALQNRLGQ